MQELGFGSVGAVATVTLALLAALLFAVSAALQQGAARQAATGSGQGRFLVVAAIARRLITDRRWLAGQGANVAGFVVHAVALRFGGIAVVQALLVVQLLFALPLAAVRRGRALLARDWAGTTAVCAGLILLVAQGVSPHSAVESRLLPEAGAAVAVAIVLLFGASRLASSTQLRSALVAVAAGCCFATTAVLVVLATSRLPEPSWALLGIPLSAFLGGVLTQEAYARGSLPTALTAMTITDPVLSYLAGSILFTATVQPHLPVLACAATLVIAGVALLANSPTLHDERDRSAEVAGDAARAQVA
ncbi:DMT family transporter [Nocardia sp. NBC_00508]|uniref:DMT family transporter n=1 Tax=Nocardia sp. NBC_00508 TaxID=2975992 RepID=UPI002E7FD7FD|nr:DMT family transporter [Nocardia sp. NBC_00508]WUD67758.1 DMT family transporter [Nocardia sp. NBC_00508]